MSNSISNSDRIKGLVFVLISALLFSTGGILIKIIPWSSSAINGSRCFFAFFVILLYMKITKHKFVINKAVIICAICNTVMSLTFVMATKMTSAANAIVLQFTEPIFVILILWIAFKNKPRKAEIIACLVAFTGMVFFFFDKLSPTGMIGNLLAIFSGLTYCGVFLVKKMPGGDLESAMVISYILGFIIGIPGIVKETNWSISVIALIAVLGILQYTISYIFLSKGLNYVTPVTASLTSMIEPILNPVLVAIFYHETVGRFALIGAVLIVGASAGYQIYDSKTNH